MVPPGELVPHQLFVAVIVLLIFSRLLPVPPAVFPTNRLKLIVSGPPPLPLPDAIPPPLPVAVFPVMVTFVSVTVSGEAGFIKMPPPL